MAPGPGGTAARRDACRPPTRSRKPPRRACHQDRAHRPDLGVRLAGGHGRRLAPRDEGGAQAEVDLRVLLADPALWLRLEADVHASWVRGTLDYGTADLARLASHVHTETARSVLRVSCLG
ncbi:hypothetical protein ACFYOG_34285 [Streptomyces sp. NPDC007818]|uniref:hypothetical protein n=1 Tax=Streptomyces sp. NPDC007818 TaxID=3364780 RepID=UPI0036A1C955